MSFIRRIALGTVSAAVLLTASAAVAEPRPAPPAPAIGVYPGCEWRPVAAERGGGEALYCEARTGEWLRVTFDPVFNRTTGERALAGDANALFLMGNFYSEGPFRDRLRALGLYRQAADKGDVHAMLAVARLYADDDDQFFPEGPPRDRAEADRLARLAADGGDLDAMVWVGLGYIRAKGADKDVAEGLRWLKRAAEAGNIYAMTTLAGFYGGDEYFDLDGEFSRFADPREVFRWRLAAAEAGHRESMQSASYAYETGSGVGKDAAKAAAWMARADAAFVQELKDRVEREGAGAPTSLFANTSPAVDLGDLYLKGERGLTRDVAEAIRWYERGAAAGDPRAAGELAELYRRGRLVPADPTMEANWKARRMALELARLIDRAEFGDPEDPNTTEAMKNLGKLYLTGSHEQYDIVVPKDPAAAARWFRKAEAAGEQEATISLAQMHAEGLVEPRDEAEAATWRGLVSSNAGGFNLVPRGGPFDAKNESMTFGVSLCTATYGRLQAFSARLTDPERRTTGVLWGYRGLDRLKPYAAALTQAQGEVPLGEKDSTAVQMLGLMIGISEDPIITLGVFADQCDLMLEDWGAPASTAEPTDMVAAGEVRAPEFRLAGKAVGEVFTRPRDADLARAGCTGDTAGVAAARAAGGSPNARGVQQFTPLMWAIACENLAGVEALLTAGANPNLKAERGTTAVLLAASMKDPQMLQALLRHGGDPNAKGEQETALEEAFSVGMYSDDWTGYYALLNAGADINQSGVAGTVVDTAMVFRRYGKALELLQRGYKGDLVELAAFMNNDVDDPPEDAQQRREMEALRDWFVGHGVKFPVPPLMGLKRDARGHYIQP